MRFVQGPEDAPLATIREYIASSRVAATSAQGTAHEQERTSAPYHSGGTKIAKEFVSLAIDEPERRIPQILMSDVNMEEWALV